MADSQYHIRHRTTKLNELYNKEPSIDSAALNKMFVGRVRDARDPQKMGRLLVWIPELSGTADDPDSWFVASYCSPFAGASYLDINMYNDSDDRTNAIDDQRIVTDQQRQPENNKDELGGRQSYGMWFTPPDIGNEIVVTFVRGDATNCIWMGSLFPQFQNHMVPGIASAKADKEAKTSVDTDDDEGPVIEADLRTVDNPQSDDNKRQKHAPLFDGIKKQGLNKDLSRGPTTSSAQRESPSQVFGILSPGGSQFVMDDGTRNYEDDPGHPGGDEFIRLRTKSGAQLLINETTGSIYAISRDGLSWLELGNDGNIDVYGKSNISIHAEAGDINLRTSGVKGDINIQSSRDINMNAARHLRVFTGAETDFISTDSFTIFSGKKTSIISTKDMGIEVRGTGSKLGISVDNDINIQSAGGTFTAFSNKDMLLKSDNKVGVDAGANMAIKAGGSIGLEAGRQFAIGALEELTITSTTKDIGIASIIGNTSITTGKSIGLTSLQDLSIVTPAVTFNSASVGVTGTFVAASISGAVVSGGTLNGTTINGGIVGATAFKGPLPAGSGTPPSPPLPAAAALPSPPPIALGAPPMPTTPPAGPPPEEAQGSPIHDGIPGLTTSDTGDAGPWKEGESYKSNTNIIPRVPQHEPWMARNTKDASATNGIVVESDSNAKLGANTANAKKPNNIISENGEVLIGTGYDNKGQPTYIVDRVLSDPGLTQPPNILKVSDETKQMIKSFETPLTELTLNAAGEETIGYGHKVTTTEKKLGTFVDSILTMKQLDDLFEVDLTKASSDVVKNIAGNLTQGQFDSLSSISMNIGSANFANSEIVKSINSNELFKTPTLFTRWASIRLPNLPNVLSLPKLPSLPSLPKLPSLPSLPSLPNLPNLPNLPSLPNIPGVSSLGGLASSASNIIGSSGVIGASVAIATSSLGSQIINVQGLANRRAAEAQLFAKIPGQDAASKIVKL